MKQNPDFVHLSFKFNNGAGKSNISKRKGRANRANGEDRSPRKSIAS